MSQAMVARSAVVCVGLALQIALAPAWSAPPGGQYAENLAALYAEYQWVLAAQDACAKAQAKQQAEFDGLADALEASAPPVVSVTLRRLKRCGDLRRERFSSKLGDESGRFRDRDSKGGEFDERVERWILVEAAALRGQRLGTNESLTQGKNDFRALTCAPCPPERRPLKQIGERPGAFANPVFHEP